jgi:hypothetical protein
MKQQKQKRSSVAERIKQVGKTEAVNIDSFLVREQDIKDWVRSRKKHASG